MSMNQRRIAEMLGVNRATISKALSGSPEISDGLKQRVRELCDELGYRPNYHARSLLTKRTGVIAILKQDLRLSNLLSDWVDCIQSVAYERGYKVRLEHIRDFPQTIAEQSADGFIAFHTPREEPQVTRYMENTERPIVFTDCSATEFRVNAVAIDNIGGGRICVDHLTDLGHRRIGFFGYIDVNGPCRDRLRGYMERARELGLPVSERDVVHETFWPFEFEECFEREQEAMALVRDGVTAFVCSSDINAVGLMKMLRRNGLSVPHDVSVTGFDDSLTARACEPPLTSVRQEVVAASAMAVDMVLRVRETGVLEDPVVAPVSLVHRFSTAPVKA